MEGRINEEGYLEIKRGDKSKGQYCHLSSITKRCGDQCPLFGDLLFDQSNKDTPWKLSLCKKELKFDKFENNRHP